MKKIFALILAIVMMASMSVVVFAEAPDDKAAGAVNGSTVLTYGVAQDYVVTIPPSTDFAGTDEAGYTATGDLKAEGVKIAKGETFTITVTSANAWTLVDTEGLNGAAISDPVGYDILIGGSSIKATDPETQAVLATATALTLGSTTTPGGNSKTVKLDFTTAGTGQEGTYVDTLTFTVAIA